MFNLLPYLSLTENVLLPCHFSTPRKRQAQRSSSLPSEARRLLVELGLETEALGKPATELSVGQQQRVAVGAGVDWQPGTSHRRRTHLGALDADTQEAFLKLLFKEVRSR